VDRHYVVPVSFVVVAPMVEDSNLSERAPGLLFAELKAIAVHMTALCNAPLAVALK
jgi:hypothetical protein